MRIMNKKYLVEILLKENFKNENGGRVLLGYEEVLTSSSSMVAYLAFHAYVSKVKYQPTLRKTLASHSASSKDVCTGEVVEIT